MLFYYTAKGTFTKLSKEEASLEEQNVRAEQVSTTNEQSPKVAENGSADGNRIDKQKIQIFYCFYLIWFYEFYKSEVIFFL